MKNLNIEIQIHSQWHCGSGLSAGADLDALVIKDQNEMPYIPGKTLKGLIKEAVDNYISFSGNTIEKDRMFGTPSDKDEIRPDGCAHFSNAVLDNKEYQAIVANKAQKYLYNKVTSTAIDDNGIAQEHSLRSMETVVPCTLYATISDVPEDIYDTICKSLGMIKRLGLKRNRGLGRCTIKEVKGGNV